MTSGFSWKKWGVSFGCARVGLAIFLPPSPWARYGGLPGILETIANVVEFPVRVLPYLVMESLNLIPPLPTITHRIVTQEERLAETIWWVMELSMVVFPYWFLIGTVLAVILSRFRRIGRIPEPKS